MDKSAFPFMRSLSPFALPSPSRSSPWLFALKASHSLPVCPQINITPRTFTLTYRPHRTTHVPSEWTPSST
ncbi:hypothetical protein BDZ89DRAFT_367606 [Hymenopellis radicata]|nr:hypothetical protein BDZ89DRAFT_367606 [Hymenopellis radicata]